LISADEGEDPVDNSNKGRGRHAALAQVCGMRHFIVPTCLFICAWAQPTNNPVFQFTADASGENVTIVTKTSPGETTGSAISEEPAETTEQALARGEVAIDTAGISTDSAFEPFENNYPLATLEIPVPAERPVPMPPRRIIPHQLVCAALADAAVDNNLPTPFLIRLIWQESGFKQNAISPVGAQGVAQFMPETAAKMKLVDPFNPLDAVRASAQLLRELFQQFGNLGFAAAAYNAGPKRVQDWLARKGKLPEETRNYVQRITGMSAEQWKGKASAATPAVRVAAAVPCQREAGLLAANGPAVIPMPQASPNALKLVLVAEQKPGNGRIQLAAVVAKKSAKVAAKAEVQTEAKAETKSALKVAAAEKPAAKTGTIKQLAAKQRTAGKAKKVQVASAHK
jgi:hypothetical protein